VEWAVPLDVLGRVVVAGLLGAIIGVEREIDDHPAGMRTVATVAIGAAIFGAVSTRGFDEFVAQRSSTNVQVDVTRVASQVVVGIGFLGAGLIFRRGGTVQNLTTAATLWAIAAVGLMAGVGNVGLATATTALLVVVLVVAPLPKRWLLRRYGRRRRTVRMALVAGTTPAALRTRIEEPGDVTIVRWRVEKHHGELVVDARLGGPAGPLLDDLIADLAASDDVYELRSPT
jgi:putative Mg2+ transporter-C (MgtC) family protein